MCPHKNMTRPIEYMDFKLYKRIIDNLYCSNGRVYLHFLGEPLLHPQLGKFIAYGKSKGFEIAFVTNGSLLSKEKSIQMIDVELDYLAISFEINQETFKKLRSGGDFKTVQKNILNFFALRNLRNKRKPFVLVSSITLNKKHDEKIAKFWEDKVDGFNYKEIHDWRGNIQDITRIAGRKKETKKICLLPFIGMCILVDGKVVPCCVDYDGTYILGDLKRDSLKSIWNGQKIITLRRALLEGRKETIELCSKCSYGSEGKGILRKRSYILELSKKVCNYLLG